MSGYTFPAKFEYLDEIRELVGNTARTVGFSEKTIYSLQLAADEAASNIIEHAYKGVENATIKINCHFENNYITITMHDTGLAFDSKTVKQPNLKADLNERQIGGLGVYLMRKLMDTVEYQSTKSGNLLTMTKRKE